MTSNILLLTAIFILTLGFVAVLSVLCEIRDAIAETCEYVRRVADELEEEDEWSVVRGNPPFGAKRGEQP